MKKPLLLLLSLLCISLSFAAPRLYISEETDALHSIKQAGAEILYHNADFILAQSDSDLPINARALPTLSPQEKLYLIQDTPKQGFSALHPHGRTLYQARNTALFATDMDEIALRGTTNADFLRIDYLPIIESRYGFIPPTHRELDTGIIDLINHVSVDSVKHYIQSLEDMQTRYALASNRYEIATWIEATFRRIGLSNVEIQPFIWNTNHDARDQYNVVGEIVGTLYPDEYIVLGAHYDSITYRTPMTFAPGADDNGSGVAATIEIARVLMENDYQPLRSIRFIAFAAEEFGLFGSKYDAQKCLDEEIDIRLYINHDMVANNVELNTVQVMPYTGAEKQASHAVEIAKRYGNLNAVLGDLNSAGSDSHSYWQRGFPSIFYFEKEFSPVYHSDDDLVINLDPAFCSRVIRGSLAATISFANMPASPLSFIPRDVGDGTSIYLKWTLPDDSTAHHYHIYHGTPNEDILLNTPISTEENEITISGLLDGIRYKFAITAVDEYVNESYALYSYAVPRSIPRQVQNVKAEPYPNAIRLSWDKNDELDLAGYNVYRYSIWSQYPAIRANREPITEHEYIDEKYYIYCDSDFCRYYVVAIDLDGNESEPSEIVKSIAMDFSRGILVMHDDRLNSKDDDDEDAVNFDSYYHSLFNQFYYKKKNFSQIDGYLELEDICQYSSIFWHRPDFYPTLYTSIPHVLERYIHYGGKVFFSGFFPSRILHSQISYPKEYDDGHIIRRVFGIASADYHPATLFKGALPLWTDMPALTPDPTKIIGNFNGHLPRVEGYTVDENAHAIYAYDTDHAPDTLQGQLFDMAVGVANRFGDGQSILLSFPLFSIDHAQAKSIVNEVMYTLFDEFNYWEPNFSIELSLSKPYPNPFKDSIRFALKKCKPDAELSIDVYNLRGQKVRSIAANPNLREYSWDGTSDEGKRLPAGIYFIQARQDGNKAAIKTLKMQ